MVRASLTLRSAMEGPGAHAQLRHGPAEEPLACAVQRAVLGHLGSVSSLQQARTVACETCPEARHPRLRHR